MTSPAQPSTGPYLSRYQRILIAYDGSENAERALSKAISLAKVQGAPLSIVVVLPPSAYEETVENGKKFLGKAAATARQAIIDVSEILRDGQPADEILQAAEEQTADLIVIGRRGLSGVERFLQGGVSSAVVTHSKCDVLVVK
jgi:nucleotide-binding universal stress UspA family protein